MMTIQEMIDQLEMIPEEDRNKPLYVFDYYQGDNFEIEGVSLWDDDQKHSESNILSININGDY